MFVKNINKILLLFLSIIALQCAKVGEFAEPFTYPNTPKGNFDSFWHGIHQNYIFFDYTDVNWQKEYDINKAKITSSTTQTQLLQICKSMFDKLIDGHREMTIPAYSTTDISGKVTSFEEQTIGVDIQDLFQKNPAINTFEFIPVNYFADQLKSVKGLSPTSNKVEEEIYYGKIPNTNIAYCKLNFFGTALSANASSVDVVEFAKFINQSQKNKSPLIIDLRLNFGGYVNAFSAFCGMFVDKPYEFGFSKVKLGMGSSDMSPFITETIQANKLAYFSNKIVILTNKFSISSSELTCLVLKEFPNVTIIGEQTFGANGPISEDKEFTGNFKMPNGWKIQLAQRITYDKNKNIFEGKGILPDISIKQSQEDAFNGIDNQLDYAINFLEPNP